MTRKIVQLVAFAAFLGLWTWKLLEPNPVPAHLTGDWWFWAAKSLHAGAYAFLAFLAVTLPVPRYWRWYLVGFLALHGVATEIGQTFVPNRTGSVRDVLIDWAGIGLGLAFARAFSRALHTGALRPCATDAGPSGANTGGSSSPRRGRRP